MNKKSAFSYSKNDHVLCYFWNGKTKDQIILNMQKNIFIHKIIKMKKDPSFLIKQPSITETYLSDAQVRFFMIDTDKFHFQSQLLN